MLRILWLWEIHRHLGRDSETKSFKVFANLCNRPCRGFGGIRIIKQSLYLYGATQIVKAKLDDSKWHSRFGLSKLCRDVVNNTLEGGQEARDLSILLIVPKTANLVSMPFLWTGV